MSKNRRLNLSIDAICPCGETHKPLKRCCLLPNGQLRKFPKNILPPFPNTNFSQQDCFLSSTHNCSVGLSREHYMSRTLLEILGSGKSVKVDGTLWQKAKGGQEVGINSLQAKILCKRHNSALAPLDGAAKGFFVQLRRIFSNLERRSLSRKGSIIIISGEELELWALKAACGIFFSKNASYKGIPISKEYKIQSNLIEEAFSNARWEKHCGLYVKGGGGHSFHTENAIAIRPIVEDETKNFIGAELIFSGLGLLVVFNPMGWEAAPPEGAGWVFRPTELSFRNDMRTHTIILTWKEKSPPKTILMTLAKKRQG